MIKFFVKIIKSVKTMSLKPDQMIDQKIDHRGLIASLLSKHPSLSALERAEKMNRFMKDREQKQNRLTDEQLLRTTSRPDLYYVKKGMLVPHKIKILSLDMDKTTIEEALE